MYLQNMLFILPFKTAGSLGLEFCPKQDARGVRQGTILNIPNF